MATRSNILPLLFEATLTCPKCCDLSASHSDDYGNEYFGKITLPVALLYTKSPRKTDFSMLISTLSSMLGIRHGKSCLSCGSKLVTVEVYTFSKFHSTKSHAILPSTSPNPVRRAKLRNLLTTHFATVASSVRSATGTTSPKSS